MATFTHKINAQAIIGYRPTLIFHIFCFTQQLIAIVIFPLILNFRELFSLLLYSVSTVYVQITNRVESRKIDIKNNVYRMSTMVLIYSFEVPFVDNMSCCQAYSYIKLLLAKLFYLLSFFDLLRILQPTTLVPSLLQWINGIDFMNLIQQSIYKICIKCWTNKSASLSNKRIQSESQSHLDFIPKIRKL